MRGELTATEDQGDSRPRDEAGKAREKVQRVESWTKAGQVRAFVDEVERRAAVTGTSAEPGTESGDWITWVRQHADRQGRIEP